MHASWKSKVSNQRHRALRMCCQLAHGVSSRAVNLCMHSEHKKRPADDESEVDTRAMANILEAMSMLRVGAVVFIRSECICST